MLMTPRPPQLETPFSVFDDGAFTPNDAFFVRWHLAGIPESVDASTHRIAVTGAVERELSLSLGDLAAMPTVEVAAVNECSGNSRGFFQPARSGWTVGQRRDGQRALERRVARDILARARLKPSAVQVQFRGLDRAGAAAATPRFQKIARR